MSINPNNNNNNLADAIILPKNHREVIVHLMRMRLHEISNSIRQYNLELNNILHKDDTKQSHIDRLRYNISMLEEEQETIRNVRKTIMGNDEY